MRSPIAACVIVTALHVGTADVEAADSIVREHDVRVAIALEPYQVLLSNLYGIYYGDTIRLGEFGCGDPRFSVTINEVPSLSLTGLLAPDGQSYATLDMSAGLNAKVHETCFGANQPSAGGIVKMSARFSDAKSINQIVLSGSLSIGLLGEVLNIRQTISTGIASPAIVAESILFESIHGDNIDINFVRKDGKRWVLAENTRSIPVRLSIGALERTPAGRQVLFLDASIGTESIKTFPTVDLARKEYDSDLPLWGDSNIGVTIRESIFSKLFQGQSKDGESSGLLPLKVSGKTALKALWWNKPFYFEAVLDSANVKFVGDSATSAVQAQFHVAEAYAYLYAPGAKQGPRVRLTNLGAKLVLKSVRFDGDGIAFDPSDLELRFVSQGVNIPIKVPDSFVTEFLRNARIPIATLPSEVAFSLPECVDMGYDKLKARQAACGEKSLPADEKAFAKAMGIDLKDPQRIGSLSKENGPKRLGLRYDKTNIQIKADTGSLRATTTLIPFSE